MLEARVVPLALLLTLELFGCGPEEVKASEATSLEETSSEETSSESDDPRWCVAKVEGAEVRTAMTEAEIECGAEITAEACEANPACTAVFGRGVQCPESGACTTDAVEFLGCIPFTICKQGTAVYCREMQQYLLTYASQQGTCVPFGMMECQTSPDYAAIGEPLPTCE